MTALDIEREVLSARILAVDDLAANLEVLSDMLQGDGYEAVTVTSDPEEGLRICEEEPVDLLLLDVRMPKIDGHEFIRRLRERSRPDPIPILVLSAQADQETRRRALAAGVRDFVNKPFIMWELLLRVRNALETQMLYKRARREAEQLEARVTERTLELEATRREVIRRLATAGEFRDNETGMHVVRMSHIAHHLALAAGLTDIEAAVLRDAAPLHDIGKIGIRDSILLKPGKLDPDEWEVMKQHTSIGGQILAETGFELLEMARTIAITHHERWDGSGYPQGLSRTEIPIAGRIVAIADVFDALTSERPYKKVWSIEATVAFIKQGAGTHFDPDLVDLFLRELPALVAIKRQFADIE
jgi:putative two-component system response regulator